MTSAGSIGELRLEEKRPSDAISLTESRDYTFEESEDDFATQGTHVESKEKVEAKMESDSKTKTVTSKQLAIFLYFFSAYLDNNVFHCSRLAAN